MRIIPDPAPCGVGSADPAGVGCDDADHERAPPVPTPDSAANFDFGFDPTPVPTDLEQFANLVERTVGAGFESYNRIDNFPGGATLPVTYRECGTPNAFYRPALRDITLCDELTAALFAAFLSRGDDVDPQQAGASALRAALGAMTFVGFHEAGHALEDIR